MIKQSYLTAFLEAVSEAQTCNDVSTILAKFLEKFDVWRFTYVFVPPYALFDRSKIRFFTHGFEDREDFVRDFTAYFQSEEAVQYFTFEESLHTRPYYALTNLPDPRLAQLKQLFEKHIKESRLKEGLMIPTFGVKTHHGLFCLSEKPQNDSPERRAYFQIFCQAAHQRITELSIARTVKIALSQRERDVLKEVVSGQSNNIIAEKLGISNHTVNGYLKRIYLKLDVTDRVSASMKTIKLHLLASETNKPANDDMKRRDSA